MERLRLTYTIFWGISLLWFASCSDRKEIRVGTIGFSKAINLSGSNPDVKYHLTSNIFSTDNAGHIYYLLPQENGQVLIFNASGKLVNQMGDLIPTSDYYGYHIYAEYIVCFTLIKQC